MQSSSGSVGGHRFHGRHHYMLDCEKAKAGLAVMTTYGYDMVMKQVRIADLKARLSEYLGTVRRGGTVTVLDRNTPIAKIIPIAQPGLRVRKPAAGAPRPNQVVVTPSELKLDVVELLLEERQGQR